jgi:hypothetical protein
MNRRGRTGMRRSHDLEGAAMVSGGGAVHV